ncbi:DEAD/DEAH box helicase [Ectothiorhodospira lacustris]|uniref:DEAD/DEAH box helicase n=1 Tax=Ectothiorhodospira lacustris TaxID=2899127 RepID=UPI001EE8A611|nr:DEAD/DEAH box helicase [Ectothiorhodospira lacustris]MCG5510450.1 DEAD/DEAH box helicase [Ectothiorhodospira lacustris]MCG5522196.1 DEAD/DEAH box helicase [Ectothiorhodospira lacustris]
MASKKQKQWISLSGIRRDCGQRSYERGTRYFEEGRTGQVRIIRRDEKELSCQAVTQGSDGRTYEQFVRFIRLQTDNGQELVVLHGECGCPVGDNCKHVVSAALALREQTYDLAASSLGRPMFLQWLEHVSEQSSQASNQAAEAVPNQECLLYQLTFHAADGSTSVSFRVAIYRKDGTPTKGREVRLASLLEPYGSTQRAMTELDRDIAQQLSSWSNTAYQRTAYHRHARDGQGTRLKGRAGALALEMMLDSGRLYWSEVPDRPLTRGASRQLELAWEVADDQYRLVPRANQDRKIHLILVHPFCYLDPLDLQVGALEIPTGMDPACLARIPSSPPVAATEVEQVSLGLARQFPDLPTPTPVSRREIRDQAPTPALAVMLYDPDLLQSGLLFHFIYEDDVVVMPHAPHDLVRGEANGELLDVHRHRAAEQQALDVIRAEGLEPWPQRPELWRPAMGEVDRQTALGRWFEVLDTVLPRLQVQGWRIKHVQGDAPRLLRADALQARVEEGQGWFDLRFDLEVDGRRIPLLPLVTHLLADYVPGTLPETLWLPMEGGQYVRVAREQIEPVLQTLVDLHDHLSADQDELRLSRLDAPRVLELGPIPVKGGEGIERLARQLAHFDGLRTVPLPPEFVGRLRPYQQHGLDWMQFLREHELAGVLADDMGLGKTVQTLAHLMVEKAAGRLTRPSLIVAPTSLLSNWRREAAQFCPALKTLVLHGVDRKSHFDTLDDYDLIFTTYPLLPRDSKRLLEQHFSHLILDEAQQIKNPRAQAAQVVRRLQADHRLCLTGTPMENHLGELWAQFDFLLPGFLGTQELFTRNYRTPIEKHGDGEKLQRLTRRITPFMLRRTKDVVARELPEKSELLRSTPIGGKQAALYESIRLAMEKKVRDAIAQKGLARSQITILDALLKLRQVCCDPRLLPEALRGGGGKKVPSAKLEMLMEMLPELISEGRRVLLFSQFTTMLGLIEQELAPTGITYTKLTGQTRKREEVISRFCDGHVPLMLISLKAGGVGLNLTQADTVIHYDPWWNPAVEAQATDRAHRIGQDKPVFVYKLITENTVEEKILALQARKQQLADQIYRGGERAPDSPPIDARMIEDLLGA